MASQNGHSEVVELLHEYGAQVDLQSYNGWTALMVASQNGHSEIVELVDLHNNDGVTALIVASKNGHSEVVKLLHECGAQVDLQSDDGSTALMAASKNGHSEVVKLLHEYGAQVDLQNNDGWTALMAASLNGHSEVVKLLHEYGAQVDLQDNDGWTALMVASQDGHSEVVKLLHKYGAQVDLQDNDGWTALMAASQDGHSEVVKLLHECGAQVDLQDNDGWTALMAASQNGHSKVVKLLHKYENKADIQEAVCDGSLLSTHTLQQVPDSNDKNEVGRDIQKYTDVLSSDDKTNNITRVPDSNVRHDPEKVDTLNDCTLSNNTQEDRLTIMKQENDQDVISTNYISNRSHNKEESQSEVHGKTDDTNHFSMTVTVEEHTHNQKHVDDYSLCGDAQRDTIERECECSHSKEIAGEKEQLIRIPYDVSGFSEESTVEIMNEGSNCYSEESHLDAKEIPPEEHTKRQLSSYN